MSRIIDNEVELLKDALAEVLPNSHQLDACIGYFNLRGWRHIRGAARNMLDSPTGEAQVRLLVGMALSGEEEVRNAFRISQKNDEVMSMERAVELALRNVQGFADQLVWGIPTNADQQGLRDLLADLESGFMKVKFYARTALHAKLYVAHQKAGEMKLFRSTVGSSNLTGAGLSGQGELNLEETDQALAQELAGWFDKKWDDTLAIDVTDALIEVIRASWAGPVQPSPRDIHLKMAYELSRDARNGLSIEIPQRFRGVLLPHQESAVQIATRILEERGLVVIGDVVGLGKTMTAAAIAATANTSVLVISPKNLTKMWDTYLKNYDIPGTVVSLSTIIQDLPDLRHYRLIIIDEAHNLRNRNTKKWKAVREYIERGDSRVVLLTATMYNAYRSDISGQLGLKFAFDQELGIRPEMHIAAVGADALAKATNGRLDCLKAFDQSDENGDWQQLLSLFLVRRTRSFLEQNYGEIDSDTGETVLKFPNGQSFHFPKRLPQPIPYPGGPNDPGDRLATVENFDAIADMKFARYKLGAYMKPSATGVAPEDEKLIADLLNSKNGASGFIRTTTLKRLTSSARAFLLTLERMLLRAYVLEYALLNNLPIPIGTLSNAAYEDPISEDLDAEDSIDVDQDHDVSKTDFSDVMNLSIDAWMAKGQVAYERLVQLEPKGLRWADPTWFDTDSLKKDVSSDSEIMREIVDANGSWDPKDDSKLNALADFVNGLPRGEKVLVFSEYKDTVDYLEKWLAPQLHGRVVQAVSGQSADPTLLARRFAPIANAEYGLLRSDQTEIDVLLTTDVLSEGQNLHDAAIVINWDLPWTIIRVIQRAGRVDRIGQRAKEIRVMSFMPQTGLDGLINLRTRLVDRLLNNADILGADERFFDDDIAANPDVVKGLFDGTAALDGHEGEVDYSSYAMGIWNGASVEEQTRVRGLPDVCFSTKKAAQKTEKVLVYCRTTSHLDVVAEYDGQEMKTLAPISALKATASNVDEPSMPQLDYHHEWVATTVDEAVVQAGEAAVILLNTGLRKRLYEFLKTQRDRIDIAEHIRGLTDLLIQDVLENPIRDDMNQRVLTLLKGTKVLGNHDEALDTFIHLNEEGALLQIADHNAGTVQIVCSMGFRG